MAGGRGHDVATRCYHLFLLRRQDSLRKGRQLATSCVHPQRYGAARIHSIATVTAGCLSWSCRSFTSNAELSPPLPPTNTNLFDTLSSRGFISTTTHSVSLVRAHLNVPRTIYAGFDPTAASLHVGNLLVLMALYHAQQAGHHVICIIGGATGMIGDPSGRKTERPTISEAEIQHNSHGIQQNIQQILSTHTPEQTAGGHISPTSPVPPAVLMNNLSWTSSLSLISFLRDVGIHYRLSSLLAKTSVSSRLATTGLSFTEFSYQLLQGYDWYWLHQHHECTVQIGGSDQWGNITAGIELINKKNRIRADTTTTTTNSGLSSSSASPAPASLPDHTTDDFSAADSHDAAVYGLTLPLLTTSAGEKFGKSAGNAVWLTASMTSPYHFYQFWLQTEDAEVDRYLKLFTVLPLTEIQQMSDNKGQERDKIKRLAEEVTRMVHGPKGLIQAQEATAALFSSAAGAAAGVSLTGGDLPVMMRSSASLYGLPVADLLLQLGAVSSKSAARRLISAGGVSINHQRIANERMVVSSEEVDQSSQVMRIRVGKKEQFIVKVTY